MVMVIRSTCRMVERASNIYDVMFGYAKSEGLTDLQAKFYADVYFDFWYLDKPIKCVNIYGKCDCRCSKAC